MRWLRWAETITDPILRPPLDIKHLRPQEASIATEVISAEFRRYLALIGLTVEGTTTPYDYLSEAITERCAWGAWIDDNIRVFMEKQLDCPRLG